MRKLDKTEILASEYKSWEETFLKDVNHPNYNSSGGRFYYDIIANLIWIQKGLCAYTEFRIQGFGKFSIENWKEGSYVRADLAGNFAGELDHYNPVLKQKQGWLWDNFFLIDSDVNSKKVKGSTVPNGLLKPDKPGFDPFYYLEYDLPNHIFLPSKQRTIDEQIDILHDINTLGLNWQPTVERRENYLDAIIKRVRFSSLSYEEAFSNLYQFYTAFELCKKYMLD